MEKFEYKTLTTDAKGIFGGKVKVEEFENKLNQLGLEGWELINCVATTQSYGSTVHVISVFKRRVS